MFSPSLKLLTYLCPAWSRIFSSFLEIKFQASTETRPRPMPSSPGVLPCLQISLLVLFCSPLLFSVQLLCILLASQELTLYLGSPRLHCPLCFDPGPCVSIYQLQFPPRLRISVRSCSLLALCRVIQLPTAPSQIKFLTYFCAPAWWQFIHTNPVHTPMPKHSALSLFALKIYILPTLNSQEDSFIPCHNLIYLHTQADSTHCLACAVSEHVLFPTFTQSHPLLPLVLFDF